MNDDAARTLRLGAGQLVGLAGMLHLGLGLRYWALYAAAGSYLPPDVRVPLWTLSGLAVLAGVAVAATRDVPRAPAYGLGIVAMLAYVLGYFSWHLGGHRSFFLVGDPQLHGVDPVRWVVDHVFAGPIEFASLAVEVVAIALLAVLLVDERH